MDKKKKSNREIYEQKKIEFSLAAVKLTKDELGKIIDEHRAKYGTSYRDLEPILNMDNTHICRIHNDFKNKKEYSEDLIKVNSPYLRTMIHKLEGPNKSKKETFVIKNCGGLTHNETRNVIKVLNGKMNIDQLKLIFLNHYEKRKTIIKKLKKEMLGIQNEI